MTKNIQTMTENQTGNGDGNNWVKSGGSERSDSGRQIERVVMITGDLDGASIIFKGRFDEASGEEEPVLDGNKEPDTYTRTGIFQLLMSPEMEFTNIITDAGTGGGAGTDVTIRVY